MNPVLDAIEQQLVAGIARDTARRRRTRKLTIGGAATLALLGGGVGIAATTGSPVERMVHSGGTGPMGFGIAADAPRQNVRVTDPGGLGWTFATYLAANGTLTATQAPDGLPGNPGGGGQSAFVIADNLIESGPAADEGSLQTIRHRGREHYLFTGAVTFGNTAAAIDHVDVAIAGHTSRATLSRAPITLPVDTTAQNLTPAGRARAAQFPTTISVRPYAATFKPDTFTGGAGPASITVTLNSGNTITYRASQNACPKNDCGRDAPEIP